MSKPRGQRAHVDEPTLVGDECDLGEGVDASDAGWSATEASG
jgi:hypothetical protein